VSIQPAGTPRQQARRRNAEGRVVSLLRRMLEPIPADDLEQLAERIESAVTLHSPEASTTPLLRRLVTDEATPQEIAVREGMALSRYFQRRQELLEGSLTTSQAARLLGKSRQTPYDRARSGALLAIRDRGALRFPPWQFDADGPDGVVQGLPQVLRAMSVSALSKASWLTRPNPVLAGEAPLDVLRRGEVSRVMELARAVGTV
jgi:hypothetical protein